MTLSILYRGVLSSCNYDCPYCPFAKRKDTRATMAADKQQVERFVSFIQQKASGSHLQGVAHFKDIQFKLFFTPWGEGLIRKHYQQALVDLSNMSHVQKVAIQTNLSCKLGWLQKANKEKIALWATYHPGQVDRQAFLDQCRQLDTMGVMYSVGVVGFKETIEEIELMRSLLSPARYLWVNALKKQADYYNNSERDRLIAVDPYVPYNMVYHKSMGRACRTGHTVISVDGDGNIYRCHFIKEKLGNLYENSLSTILKPRLCTNATCGCHIGYVHMNDLKLYDVYKGRELERIVE
jgi:MoaA/NifB/PqqE/SkfB family radical SAM enzyme